MQENKLMKHLFAALVMACIAIMGNAMPRTQADALSKAQEFLKSRGQCPDKLEPFSGTSASRLPGNNGQNTGYYIFNMPDDQGFVIVSGDDRMNDILGYSDSGSLQAGNIPDGLAALLESYAIIANSPVASGKKSPRRKGTNVEPLLGNIFYNQDAPYNHYCPLYNDQRCLTGCVNTALAQIMAYHKWPSKLYYDIPAYTTSTNMIRVDGVKTEGQTYDWSKIDDYYAIIDEPGCDDLARLTFHIGAALKADYTPNATATYLDLKKLMIHFGYSIKMKLLYCKDYEDSKWFSIIDNELACRRPLYMAAEDSDNNAHAFVLDGRDSQGLYHINWGWGGPHGYYDIPSEDSGMRFVYRQYIGIGIQPDENGFVIKDDVFYYYTDKSQKQLICGLVAKKPVGNLVIPATVNSVPVVGIADNTFCYCKDVTSLVLPEGLRYIGQRAFEGCESLKSVTLPSTLDSVGVCAFYDCRVDEVHISDFNAYCRIKLQGKIEGGDPYLFQKDHPRRMFLKGELLTELDIPGIENIPYGLFRDLPDVTTVRIGEGTKVISDQAFGRCESLTTAYLPHSLDSVPRGAFKWTPICEYHFTDLNTLANLRGTGIPLSESNNRLFIGGKEIVDELSVPAGVKKLDRIWGINIKTVRLEEGVTDIEINAFRKCGIDTLYIPSTLESISGDAFKSNSVHHIFTPSVEAFCRFKTPDGFLLDGYTLKPYNLYVDGVKTREVYIPGSIAELRDGLFSGFPMTKISIGEGVRHIGRKALDCIYLNYVKLPSTIKTVYESSFSYDVKEWHFADINTLFRIDCKQEYETPGWFLHSSGYRLYEGGRLVSELNFLPMDTIPDQFLCSCEALKKITIAEGTKVIKGYAFFGIHDIRELSLPASLDSIGEGNFYCEPLQSCTCHAITPPATAVDVFNTDLIKKGVLSVPQESLEIYRQTYPWSEFGAILPIPTSSIDVIEYGNNAKADLYRIDGTILRRGVNPGSLNPDKGVYILRFPDRSVKLNVR